MTQKKVYTNHTRAYTIVRKPWPMLSPFSAQNWWFSTWFGCQKKLCISFFYRTDWTAIRYTFCGEKQDSNCIHVQNYCINIMGKVRMNLRSFEFHRNSNFLIISYLFYWAVVLLPLVIKSMENVRQNINFWPIVQCQLIGKNEILIQLILRMQKKKTTRANWEWKWRSAEMNENACHIILRWPKSVNWWKSHWDEHALFYCT